ncbi:MAG: hypothetical protein OER86_13940, partial [Phycisphaerae bacterium]|nr:hypothetical protein [Phycisphaerae bacterium]
MVPTRSRSIFSFALSPALLLLGGLLSYGAAVQEDVVAEKHRTGAVVIEAEGVPYKTYVETFHRYGGRPKPEDMAKARKGMNRVESAGVRPRWQVHVPQSYDPSIPHGVLVFINSGDSGKVPGKWTEALARHRLIWIGADASGNKKDTLWRHSLAVHAVGLIKARYSVDEDRVYVSGNSGGGRVSSQVAIVHGDLFDGGFYHIGCNPYRSLSLEGNKYLPGFLARPNPRLLARARVNRFVLLTGEKDFNRDGTKKVFQLYQKDGFRNVTYLEVPGMAHRSPPADWFAKGIAALDQPLGKEAAKTHKLAGSLEKRGQFGRALAAYTKAAAHGKGQEFAEDAAARAQA